MSGDDDQLLTAIERKRNAGKLPCPEVIAHRQHRIDSGVTGDMYRFGRSPFAPQVFGRFPGRGKMQFRETAGEHAVHLLGKGSLEIEGPQAGFDMGDGNARIEGCQRTAECGSGIALHDHQPGLHLFVDGRQCFQQPRG